MASKIMIFAIFVLLGISLTAGNSSSATPTTTDTSTTAVGTSPNTTATTPDTTSTPNMTTTYTDPTATTVNGTEPQNNTSPSSTTEPTTTPIATTKAPPEIGTWTVEDKTKNLTCMMMTFKGTVTKTTMDPILIPSTASSGSSSCSDKQSSFVLEFEDQDMNNIAVTLSFVMQNEETSYLWSSSITYNQTTENEVQILFETPVGKSYQCNEQVVSLGPTYSLKLEDLQLQPFASFANHDFGKAFSCEVAPSGPNAAVIVGLVLGAIIVILLIAVISLYRKKKGPGRGYNNFS